MSVGELGSNIVHGLEKACQKPLPQAHEKHEITSSTDSLNLSATPKKDFKAPSTTITHVSNAGKKVSDSIGKLMSKHYDEKLDKYITVKTSFSNKIKYSYAAFRDSVKLLFTFRKFQKMKEYGAVESLPEQQKAALKAYWKTPKYWMKRFTNPSEVKLQETLIQGAPAIKAIQADVERFNKKLKPELEKMVKQVGETNKFAAKALNWVLEKTVYKGYRAKESLLTNVPGKIGPDFKKPLDDIEAAYNLAHPGNGLIAGSRKSLDKAGSIGQVFEATRKDGTKIILKVVKPDLTPKHMAEYENWFAFNHMVDTGESKKIARAEGQNTVSRLQEEIDSQQEVKNTQHLAKWVKENGLKLQVPKIQAATEHGMAMEMVGTHDFMKLTSTQQAQAKTMFQQDFAKLFAFSPHKPLDMHSGNIRASLDKQGNVTDLYLIDHGRQFNLDEVANNKLLNLLTHTYSQPISSSKGLGSTLANNDVRNSLWDFLDHVNDAQNLKNLETLNKHHEMNESDIKAGKSVMDAETTKAHQELTELVNKLFKGQAFKNEEASFMKAFDTPEKTDWALQPLKIHEVWANTMKEYPGKLSDQVLSQQDLKAFHDKSSGLLKTGKTSFSGDELRDPWLAGPLQKAFIPAEEIKSHDTQLAENLNNANIDFAIGRS